MTRLPRALTTLTALAAGLAVGVAPQAASASTSTGQGSDLEVVTTTTTTADINTRVVTAGDTATAPIVQRAMAGPTRLAGADRYETSVAISKRAYSPGTAKTVYLVGGNRLDEALAGAALTDGPVLLVPTTGTVPRTVRDEIARLSPSQVVALGGSASVSSDVLGQAAGGISTTRLGSNDVYATTVAIARRAFPEGASHVYVAQVGGRADAVVGGALKDGPVLPVPATGAAPAAVRSLVASWGPSKVTGLGGTGAISATTLASAAGGRPTDRLAGADRYATAQAVARAAFPSGASVAYLAGGTMFADAVVGGMLADGPILLTPPASATTWSKSVANTLTGLGVRNIGTLGGSGAVSDAAIGAVAAKVPTATTGSLPTYRVPGAPAPSPAPTEAPTPPPAPAPAPVPAPAPAPAPAPRTTTTTPTAPLPDTCAEAIASFRPVPRDSRYTISCVRGFDTSDTLGLTETWVSSTTGEFVEGRVKIRSDLRGPLLRAVIAHELSHAWSYSELTTAQRAAFARFTGVSDWGDGDYDEMPAEVWARTQATCVGYPDGYGRKQVTCDDIARFGWRR